MLQAGANVYQENHCHHKLTHAYLTTFPCDCAEYRRNRATCCALDLWLVSCSLLRGHLQPDLGMDATVVAVRICQVRGGMGDAQRDLDRTAQQAMFSRDKTLAAGPRPPTMKARGWAHTGCSQNSD
jgi:hypothetical protein